MSSPSHADLLREYLELLSQPGAEARLPIWTDWFRLRVGGAVAVGAALALTGCDDSDAEFGNPGGAAGASQAQSGTGGTRASVAAGGSSSSSGTVNGSAVYAAPMASGGNIGGTKYGVPMTNGGSGNPGSAVAVYAIVMSGGSDNPGSVSRGGNSNSGIGSAIAVYAAPMTGGNSGLASASGLRYGVPVSTGGSYNMSARYGVPMDP